ncbi:MAG: GNAT family N-acetyltransferase [Betaproteobacteria bacterium]|nr:GNAT family N-acetyltransferase [Betaproteobacteria bacterium]MCL2886848.1 GNAT family N-acetyltransferase [Betaproteobacteria bacterium]
MAAPEVADVELIAVTDATGAIVEPGWLGRAETVHRQLRPQLPADYMGRLSAVFANGGRMLLAIKGGAVRGVALWRLIENTYEGRRLYIDDLVIDEKHRSQGVGRRLLAALRVTGEACGCDVLALDSGVQRQQAHKFYFREGMTISSFCFKETIQ